MNHQVLVSVLHRRTHLAKQIEALHGGKLSRIAILIDRLALYVFDHQVRLALFSRTAVEEPRDIGMIEVSQNLAFGFESAYQKIRVKAGSDQLDRYLFVVLVVRTHGLVDRAHAALRDGLADLVIPDPAPLLDSFVFFL